MEINKSFDLFFINFFFCTRKIIRLRKEVEKSFRDQKEKERKEEYLELEMALQFNLKIETWKNQNSKAMGKHQFFFFF